MQPMATWQCHVTSCNNHQDQQPQTTNPCRPPHHVVPQHNKHHTATPHHQVNECQPDGCNTMTTTWHINPPQVCKHTLPPLSLLTGKPGATSLTVMWQPNTKTSHGRWPPPPPRNNCPHMETTCPQMTMTAQVQKQNQMMNGIRRSSLILGHHVSTHQCLPPPSHHTTPSPLTRV